MMLVECKPDKLLVQILRPGLKVKHGGNKPDVIKLMLKHGWCGMVDEDPGAPKPKSFKKFKLVRHYHGFSLYRYNQSFLVVVSPKLEDFIIQASQRAGIDLNEFRLPNDPDSLHRIINKNLDNLEPLLVRLKKKKVLDDLERCLKALE